MLVSQVNIQRALPIGGWMSVEELTWLANIAQESEKIVEFGSYYGRSTMCLADNIRPGGRIWAVDPWNGSYKTEGGVELHNMDTYAAFYIFRQNMVEHIKSGTVIPSRAYSQNFKLPFQVDFTFIDGDHTTPAIKRDIAKAEELTKPGGIIAGHDYNHPTWYGIKQVVDDTYGPKIGLVDTIWWIRKS